MKDITNFDLFTWDSASMVQDEAPVSDGMAPEEGASIDRVQAPAAGSGGGVVTSIDAKAGLASDASGRTTPVPPTTGGISAPSPDVRIEHVGAQPVRQPEFFDQALAQVARQGFFEPERMRRVRSDIVVAARMMGSTLEQLPCDPVLLRVKLRRVLPERFRIKPQRWSSIKSSLIRVLKLTGWHDTDDALQTPLGSEWQAGCDLLPELPQLLPRCPQKAAFAHFARFCQRSGICPGGVTEETVEAYRGWKTRRTLELDIPHHVSAVRRLWNLNVSNHPAWPQRHLHTPHNPSHYGLTLEQVPPSLRTAIEDCCASMARFTPLNPRETKVYSRHTIHAARGILLRATGILVRKGADLSSLQGMHDVLCPAAIRCVLKEHAERLGNGKGWAASSSTVAITLKRTARISGALTDAELAEVERLCGMVKPRPPRLTSRGRERLAQFDEPAVLLRFLKLPKDCFEAADRILIQGRQNRYGAEKKAARLSQKALALAILCNKPLRREDLAELDLATDFRRDTKGRIVGLCIPGSKTKTGRDEEAWFELPLIKRIERYLKVYRPLLYEGDSTFLFPGRIDGHRAPSTMAAELKRLVQDQIGAEFNVHLVRHLAAGTLLEDDPQNMPVAQRLLGHGQLKTTERYYGQAKTRGAQRKWAEVLQRKMRQLKRKARP
jgi:integrase